VAVTARQIGRGGAQGGIHDAVAARETRLMVHGFVFACRMACEGQPAAFGLIAQEAQLGEGPFLGLHEGVAIEAEKTPRLVKTQGDCVFGGG
jgi:hypothetical protein